MNDAGSSPSSMPAAPAPRAWFAVGVLFVAVIFSFIDRIILSLLVEPIKTDLGLDDADFAWLLGVAFAVFFALFGLPIGRWADRYSRRLIISLGIVVWSLMTMACGLADNFWELFFARVGVAAGEAALAPAAFSLISDLFPRDQLGRALGVYQSGAFVGAGIALLVGGAVIALVAQAGVPELPVLGQVAPWQVVFFAVGAPGFLVALAVLAIPEPVRRGVGSGMGVAPTVGAVVRYARERWRIYGLHFLGFALLAVPITTTLTWAPAYFGRILGMTPAEVGLNLGLIVVLLSPAGVYAGGWLADLLMRRGYPDATHRVGLLAAACLVPLTLVATSGSDRATAILLFCPLTFCASLSLACAPAALQLVTPPPMRAQISAAWMLCLNVITAIVGPTAVGLVSGKLFADPLSIGRALAIINVSSLPLAALALGYGRRAFGAAVAGKA